MHITDITSWVAILSAFTLSLTIALALLLDLVLGEAKKYHYLVGFGWLCQLIEKNINPDHLKVTPTEFSLKSALLGAFSWLILVLPIPLIYLYFCNDFFWYWQLVIDGVVLYLAIGLNSLNKHAMQVYQPLKSGELAAARHFTGYLVSRKTNVLSPDDMARATVESMLENGHDSVIASMVYYLIGGAPLVILHRFANTLDAMWGYKNPRYIAFGYASARLDDLLGFLTAKFCTLLYAIQGRFWLSLKNAYQQGNIYKSHNGGWVMAAGATVLRRCLGGAANYHGITTTSVTLGAGKAVECDDIPRSINVVRRAAVILLLLVFIYELSVQRPYAFFIFAS